MAPITEFISDGSSEKASVNNEKLCKDIGTLFNTMTGAELWDSEVGETISVESEDEGIKIACTVGDNEYPDRPDPSFRPTDETIDATGAAIVDLIKKSGANVPKLVVERWSDTTFMGYEQSEVEADELQEPEDLAQNPVEKFIDEPVMKVVVTSTAESIAQSGGDVKEFESGFATEFQKKLVGISPNAKAFFGNVSVVVKVVVMREVDFSVEFDGDIKGDKMPEDIRGYMANAALHTINGIKPNCTGEVWIRQGQPNTKVYPV